MKVIFKSCEKGQNQYYNLVNQHYIHRVGAAHKPRIFKFRENQMREIQEVPVIVQNFHKSLTLEIISITFYSICGSTTQGNPVNFRIGHN